MLENGLNVASNAINSTVSAVSGAYTLNPASIVSGITGLLNVEQQLTKAEQIPPQINGNTNCGDVAFANYENAFHFSRNTIRREYAEKIDDYFNRFGYRTNKLKIPNITGRQNWNFVKIAPTEIIGNGNIHSSVLNELNSIFQNGVTIWHNHDNINNYNLSNNII